MNFGKFIHTIFGKDVFSLNDEDIVKERINSSA